MEVEEGFQAFGPVGSGETTTAIGRRLHPSVRFLLRLFTEAVAVALLAAGRTASKIVQSSAVDYVIIRP